MAGESEQSRVSSRPVWDGGTGRTAVLATVSAGSPGTKQPGFEAYAAAPRPEERVLRTFCGT